MASWRLKRSSRRRQAVGGSAAAVALLVGAWSFDFPMRLRADAITGVGERREIRLDDGSLVTLNTASAVRIAYSASERRVELLRGEAAFRVARNPARPFVVAAGGGSATALGTRYIVREMGDATEVAVTEHSVRVAYPSAYGGGSRIVRAGEDVRYGKAGLSGVAAIDIEGAEAWTRGSLVFHDQPLREVVAEIARYHRGLIRVLDDHVGERRISGVFPTSDPLAAIQTLEQSFGLRTVRLTNRIILITG